MATHDPSRRSQPRRMTLRRARRRPTDGGRFRARGRLARVKAFRKGSLLPRQSQWQQIVIVPVRPASPATGVCADGVHDDVGFEPGT